MIDLRKCTICRACDRFNCRCGKRLFPRDYFLNFDDSYSNSEQFSDKWPASDHINCISLKRDCLPSSHRVKAVSSLAGARWRLSPERAVAPALIGDEPYKPTPRMTSRAFQYYENNRHNELSPKLAAKDFSHIYPESAQTVFSFRESPGPHASAHFADAIRSEIASCYESADQAFVPSNGWPQDINDVMDYSSKQTSCDGKKPFADLKYGRRTLAEITADNTEGLSSYSDLGGDSSSSVFHRTNSRLNEILKRFTASPQLVKKLEHFDNSLSRMKARDDLVRSLCELKQPAFNFSAGAPKNPNSDCLLLRPCPSRRGPNISDMGQAAVRETHEGRRRGVEGRSGLQKVDAETQCSQESDLIRKSPEKAFRQVYFSGKDPISLSLRKLKEDEKESVNAFPAYCPKKRNARLPPLDEQQEFECDIIKMKLRNHSLCQEQDNAKPFAKDKAIHQAESFESVYRVEDVKVKFDEAFTDEVTLSPLKPIQFVPLPYPRAHNSAQTCLRFFDARPRRIAKQESCELFLTPKVENGKAAVNEGETEEESDLSTIHSGAKRLLEGSLKETVPTGENEGHSQAKTENLNGIVEIVQTSTNHHDIHACHAVEGAGEATINLSDNTKVNITPVGAPKIEKLEDSLMPTDSPRSKACQNESRFEPENSSFPHFLKGFLATSGAFERILKGDSCEVQNADRPYFVQASGRSPFSESIQDFIPKEPVGVSLS